MVRELGLERNVTLQGSDLNPSPWIAAADAFVLPSRFEGMPNAALEALALGTPVIATPDAGGISEVPGVIIAEAGGPLRQPCAASRQRPCSISVIRCFLRHTKCKMSLNNSRHSSRILLAPTFATVRTKSVSRRADSGRPNARGQALATAANADAPTSTACCDYHSFGWLNPSGLRSVIHCAELRVSAPPRIPSCPP